MPKYWLPIAEGFIVPSFSNTSVLTEPDKVKSEIDGTVQYYRSIVKDENNIFNIKVGKDYWIKNNYKDHAIITICNNGLV